MSRSHPWLHISKHQLNQALCGVGLGQQYILKAPQVILVQLGLKIVVRDQSYPSLCTRSRCFLGKKSSGIAKGTEIWKEHVWRMEKSLVWHFGDVEEILER